MLILVSLDALKTTAVMYKYLILFYQLTGISKL